jgi:hypothetical protein
MIPRKRERPKMGVREATQKMWPRHRRFVKSHCCCVPGCQLVLQGIAIMDFAHWRSAANAGMKQTPHDAFGLSLCRDHHNEQHSIGQPAFERKYGIDMRALALEFTRRSPDVAMKASLALTEPERAAAVP